MGRQEKLKQQRKEEALRKKEKKSKIKKAILFYFLIVIAAFLTAFGGYYFYQKITSESASTEPKTYKAGDKLYSQYPDMQIDQNKEYTADMETSYGNIKIKLDVKNTPKTANNFIVLSKDKFYDNIIFHRVINGFMIQGGDPEGNGSGSPGYQFDDEDTSQKQYKKGVIAMANSGPNTNGSQFFIMHQDNLDLPPSYTIFGEVIEGIETVDKIAEAEVGDSG